MEHINRIRKSGDIDHTIGTGFIPNPQLLHPSANAWHGFKVIRLKPFLNPIQLIARILPRPIWKVAQTLQTITYKAQRFHTRKLYQNRYKVHTLVSPRLDPRLHGDNRKMESPPNAKPPLKGETLSGGLIVHPIPT